LSSRDLELKQERDRIQLISNKMSRFEEIEGQAHSLEQKFEYLLRRNDELEEENEKLVRHNNFKQKLQYHLQIKQENNTLRSENQKLSLEMDRMEKRLKEIGGGTVTSSRRR
jgi:predicted RNase H-like nuclease (RuvC/YqgF family)